MVGFREQNGGYERGLNTLWLRWQTGNGLEDWISTREACDLLGVTGIIRVPIDDRPQQAVTGDTWTHFGLPVHDYEVGQLCAICWILEPGWFNEAKSAELLPLLSLQNVWLVKLVRIVPEIPYNEISWGNNKNVFGGVANVNQLMRLIESRYSPVLVGKSMDEIWKQGVSVREFEFIRAVSVV